jgi:hypothetical protein
MHTKAGKRLAAAKAAVADAVREIEHEVVATGGYATMPADVWQHVADALAEWHAASHAYLESVRDPRTCPPSPTRDCTVPAGWRAKSAPCAGGR